MRKMTSLVLVLISASATTFAACEEKICVRCEEARKYNAEHPNTYEYYEDYLKANDKNAPAQSQSSNQQRSKDNKVIGDAKKPKTAK